MVVVVVVGELGRRKKKKGGGAVAVGICVHIFQDDISLDLRAHEGK